MHSMISLDVVVGRRMLETSWKMKMKMRLAINTDFVACQLSRYNHKIILIFVGTYISLAFYVQTLPPSLLFNFFKL